MKKIYNCFLKIWTIHTKKNHKSYWTMVITGWAYFNKQLPLSSLKNEIVICGISLVIISYQNKNIQHSTIKLFLSDKSLSTLWK